MVQCLATSGTFTLKFRQADTASLSYDSNSSVVESALSSISTIGAANVTFSSGDAFCTSDASNAALVHFVHELSVLPALSGGVSLLRRDLEDAPRNVTTVSFTLRFSEVGITHLPT